VVANASSGSADSEVLRSVCEVVSALGPVEVRVPPSAERFRDDVVDAASRSDLLVVAGGDGTLNLVVDALADRLGDVVLGLVPMGTGNDLARTLGIPDDPVRAANSLVKGRDRALDLGRARGPNVDRLFANACIGGFPVEMNQAIDADLKRRLGPAAFWVGGAKAAVKLERTVVRMNSVEVPDCLAVGVGNGRTSGGGIPVWPSARVDDGLLEGCALGAHDHAAAARLALKLKSGEHAELEGVVTTRARTITIDSDPPIEINVDGELVGLMTPATFEIVDRFKLRF
jgi:diacylglycerol kinase (ATP)